MKSRIWLLSLSLLTLVILPGCKKDEEGTLKITFKGSFGNNPLVMFAPKDYVNGQRILFSRSEFFASDIKLISDSGEEYPLSDIELIDLSFTSQSAAETGVILTFNDIPAGNYSDFQFGFGVASDINATVPADYLSSSPLSNAGRYWTAWNSFIFSKTEGNIDTLVNGTDDLNLGFAYHTGTDNLYTDLSLNNPVSIKDDGSTSIVFDLDHQKLMGLPAEPLDIKANPQNHNPNDLLYIQAIADNFLTALTFIIE